jgi:acetyl-CoA synthetase
MAAERIAKSTIHPSIPHHLQDYATECRAFSWGAARSALDGLPGGGLNIAHEAIDRHVAHTRFKQAC